METVSISEETLARVKEFSLPSYKEIPDIGLFLEQTVKFVGECVKPLEGITVTGSMISNYVKMKLIANPVKKQYSREQISDAIFIVLVKSVLSLEETDRLLKLLKQGGDSRSAYEYVCTEFKLVLCQVFGAGEDGLPEPDTVREKLLRRVLTMIAYKIYLNEAFRTLE